MISIFQKNLLKSIATGVIYGTVIGFCNRYMNQNNQNDINLKNDFLRPIGIGLFFGVVSALTNKWLV